MGAEFEPGETVDTPDLAVAPRRALDWPAVAFMTGTPLAAAVLVPLQLLTEGMTVGLAAFAVVYTVLSSLATTAGYHRLFAHRSYRAAAPLRLAYLLFGAAAWQNSALHWVLRHRRHHRYEDTERDPHDIHRGLFHAHVGWIGQTYPVEFSEFPPDLRGDPLIVWQHRYYLPLAVGMGFILPGIVGFVGGWGWGGLVWAGLARVVFTHHCSFLVNSWAHRFGRRTYSRATSARDSVAVALLTYGEGFHNFHHTFPHDYRNGIRWFDWDPTKWLIRALASVGLASNLRRAPRGDVERAKGQASGPRPRRMRLRPFAASAYVLIHLGCLGVFYTGVSGEAMAVLGGAFLFRVFGSSIVYHRYFAHRSFQTSRPMQFVLGVYGATTVLGGPLWWAQTHRAHHQHADTPDDIHSPHYQGFLYAHCGWFLNQDHRDVDLSKVPDLARFPELVWLDRWDLLFKALYLGAVYTLFGSIGIVWGFCLPTVLILQMTHWVQSVSHSLGGYRRYPTPDNSRNHWLFGVLSMGEGFHHNHHSYPGSARMGLRWWELDASYGVLVALRWLGLVWNLRVPSERARAGRDPRLERHVVAERVRVRELGARLARALDGLEAAGVEDLRGRLALRINVFVERARDLLVAGPFARQEAFEELRRDLGSEVRAVLAFPADRERLDAELALARPPISTSEWPPRERGSQAPVLAPAPPRGPAGAPARAPAPPRPG